jgi:CBS domain-containing protein
MILGILVVKSLIWAVALGSGTSGGVLAPLLMMGGALGGAAGAWLPNEGPGFWPLVMMGAILGGTMRSPFTGIVFAIELTHDLNMLLPLLVANFIAHGFTVLVLKRSILTEKLSRRGYHLSREYDIDPLEILFVREVMRTNLVALQADSPLETVQNALRQSHGPRGQYLYPVLGGDNRLAGVVTREDLVHAAERAAGGEPLRLSDMAHRGVVAYPDEPLRLVVYRMAETGHTRMPVVKREDQQQLVGLVSLEDLLQARTRKLNEERTRERVLRIRLPIRDRAGAAAD